MRTRRLSAGYDSSDLPTSGFGQSTESVRLPGGGAMAARARKTIASSDRAALVLAATATTLMLEAMRVFVSDMIIVLDQSNRVGIGLTTLAVFLGIGLAGPLAWLLGKRATLLISIALLGAARLILQSWELPTARLALGAIVVTSWGWLTIALLFHNERGQGAIALGIASGMTLDLGVRITAGTVDLPWMPGIAAHIVTALLVATLIGTALLLDHGAYPSDPLEEDGTDQDRVPELSSMSLVAVGGGLALYQLLTGNLGLAEARLRASFPAAAATLALGAILGLVIGPLLTGTRRPHGQAATLGVTAGSVALICLGNWLVWHDGLLKGLRAVGLILTGATGLILITQAIAGRTAAPGRVRTGAVTAWFTLGMLVQAVVLFAYYTFSGRPSIIWFALGLLALGPLAAQLVALIPSTPSPSPPPLGWSTALPAIGSLGLLLLIACLARWAAWSRPSSGPPPGPTLTVMTYNIQSGFARDGTWNLEHTAEAIAAQHPDVVMLQEVSRGWLVTSGVDEALWLSRRLDMPLIFGPNSDDGLWGNAVLTRAPILTVAYHQYSRTQNLKREAIEVELATHSGNLWVFGTHLDDPVGADAVRLMQTRQLIGFIGARRPAVVLGDFNSDPGTQVLTMLAASDLHDLGATLGPGAYTSHDFRRIDYILGSSGIRVTAIAIPDVWASDHRPVFARIELAH